MGKETKLYKTKEPRSRAEIGELLHRLADDVAQGSVRLDQGQREVVLELPDILQLEVEAESEEKGEKGSEHSIEIELKWRVGQEHA